MRIYKKILCVILSSILTVAFIGNSVSIGALTVSSEWSRIPSPAPQETSVDGWYHPETLYSVERNSRFLKIITSLGESKAELYLSFPSLGGFRLENERPVTDAVSVEKTAVFAPDFNIRINYVDNPDGSFSMTGTDKTAVVFLQNNGYWQFKIKNSSNNEIMVIDASNIYFGITDGKIAEVKIELPLADNEVLYGTGERFNGVNQNGKSTTLWNCDVAYHAQTVGESGIEKLWRSYKNVPIIHSNNGYSLFYNSTCAANADFGETNKSKYSLLFDDNRLDLYFWAGTMSENIVKYTDLTGKSYLPPKWAFQYQAGGSGGFWNSISGNDGQLATAKRLFSAYDALGTPLNTVFLEGVNLGDSDNSVAAYFAEKGVHMLKWNCPDTVSTEKIRTLMPELQSSQWPFIRNNNNSFCGTFIDFFDNNGVTLLKRYLQTYVDSGISGGMCDFSELIPVSTTAPSVGLNGNRLHNFYPYAYAKAYSEVYDELTGNNSFCFIRGGCAGSQKWAGIWSGDQYNSWAGLRMQLSAGLSAASSGFSIWGTDLCGLDGQLNDELFCRGLLFGTFSPIMRTGGNVSKLPTDYSVTVQDTYKKAYWLRESLLNKLYSSAVDSSITGLPMMQAMAVAFPNEQSVQSVENQYMFCDDFLVCPVLSQGATTQTVVLPEGKWYDFLSGQEIYGGKTITADAEVSDIPVYVRSGAVVPLTLDETLTLGKGISGTNKRETLLITPPEKDRTVVYHIDTEKEAKYNIFSGNSYSFRLQADENNSAENLIICGTLVYEIKVDGESIPALSAQPSSTNEIGYYSYDGITKVYLGDSAWKTVDVQISVKKEMNSSAINQPEKIYFGDLKSNLTEKSFVDYYETSSQNGVTVYRRNANTVASNSFNWQKNVAFIYEDCIGDCNLDFNYGFSSAKSGQQWIWIDLGNQNKGSASSYIGLGISSYAKSATCKIRYIGTEQKDFDQGIFDGTIVHHARISVNESYATVIIDDEKLVTVPLGTKHNGSFIGIGTNYSQCTLSDIKVDGNGGVYFGHSGSEKGNGIKVLTDIENYYQVQNENGTTVYNTLITGASWWGDVPLINLGKYQDFKLSFDFSFKGNGERYLWLNMGLDSCTLFNSLQGASRIAIGVKDGNSQNSFLNCFYSDTSVSWFDDNTKGWLDNNRTITSGFDATTIHHLDISVSGEYITFDFDNGLLKKCKKMNSAYHGGYVMIGSNYQNTIIKNIKIDDCNTPSYSCVCGDVSSAKYANPASYFFESSYCDSQIIRKNYLTDTTAIPFLDIGEAHNFSLDFDLSIPAVNQWVWVTYGTNRNENYLAKSNSGSIGIKLQENNGCVVSVNGTIQNIGRIKNANRIHIAVIIYNDNLIIKADDLQNTFKIPASQSGNVLLGTGCGNVEFSGVSLSLFDELSNNEKIYVGNCKEEKTELPAVAYYTLSDNHQCFKRESINSGSDLTDGTTAFFSVGKSKDFYLEFDYEFAQMADEHGYVWLNIGAETLYNAVNSDGKLIGIGNNKFAQLCKIGEINEWVYIGAYKQNGRHHIQLSVIDGVLNIKIDGALKNSMTIGNDYQGGCVLLGLNRAAGELSNIYYETLDKNVFEKFSAWYTDNISTDTLSAEALGRHWRFNAENDSLERTGLNYADNNLKNNYSVLFYEKKPFYNLETSFDYKITDQGNLLFGFGMNKGVWSDKIGNAFCIKSDGTLEMISPVDGTSIPISEKGRIFTLSAQRKATHRCDIRIKNNRLFIYIDNICQCNGTELTNYEGGYVSFGANSEFSTFSLKQIVESVTAESIALLKKCILREENKLIYDYNEDEKISILDLIKQKKIATSC